MKSNLLLNKMYEIQFEYKNLLTVLLPKLKSRHMPEALDEINLFWIRNMGAVQLYLRTWFPGKDSFVFTAATCMDVANGEHLPYLIMGDKRILDDPLSLYSKIHIGMTEGKDAQYLYEQIGTTAECNLRVLERVCPYILILPLRLMSQNGFDDSLYKIGEYMFISLFNEIEDLRDYFSKCDDIDDVIRFARKDIGNLVMFSEYDDMALPFKERFQIALEGNQYTVSLNKTDAENFFHLVFGGIMQAVDVITSCVEYGCVPYIRYPVALHYISLISESMLHKKHIKMLRFKMGIAFVVCKLFDVERFSEVSLKEFVEKSKEYDFYGKLFGLLSENNIDENNFTLSNVRRLISDELEEFSRVILS